MLLSTIRSMAIAAAVAVPLAMLIASVSAQPARAGCWSSPPPKSLVEAGHVASNRSEFTARVTRARSKQPAALLLSDGGLKAAFAAGLLVGWSETGTRPEFDTVTAVGTSALVGVFAFLGPAGDRFIADLFACARTSWRAMAERASDMLDREVLSALATRHRAGRRLLIAIEGNAARRSGYWNIGWIAANRPADARSMIRSILLAAVSLSKYPQTATVPAAAGGVLPRNYAFRHVGSGRAVLPPIRPLVAFRSIYVMHNDVIRRDDRRAFAAKLRGGRVRRPSGDRLSLRTLHHIDSQLRSVGQQRRVVTVKRRRWFAPNDVFDPEYMKTIFDRSHRAARMGRLWGQMSAL
ncbi:MAG: hypothetical protein ACR2PI_07930 [Hyphomicrobiaceae bacterium]